jgi:hypothetical protein
MPLSEEAARTALAEAGSPAADPATYQAQRRERGWAFGWRPEAGTPSIGTIAWVVADNGAARGCRMSESVDDVIDHLLEAPA